MFDFVGRLTSTRPLTVCAAWMVLGTIITCAAPRWDANTEDDDIHFLPAQCASVRGYELLRQSFPRDVFACQATFALERPEARLTRDDFRLADALVGDLKQLRRAEPELGIGQIMSCRDGLIGERLTSADGRCTLIQMSLGRPYLALQTQLVVDRATASLQRRLAQARPGAPALFVTGSAGIGRDLLHASAGGLEVTTLATVVLVVIILLLVYRSPVLALVPLATIALSVWVALKLLALLTLLPGVHLVNVSRMFAIVILYGAGTDYCLFLISRYQEHLAEQRPWTEALWSSVRQVGGPVTASAATIICGLGLMGFAQFAKVRCAGPAIGLGLVVAWLASLTLAPALLRLLGRRAFWPGRWPHAQDRVRGRRAPFRHFASAGAFWERVSRLVVARPVLTFTLAVIPLLPLAVIGLQVVPCYKPTGELSASSSSVQGLHAIQRHFTAGEIGPITVLLNADIDWCTPPGRAVIAHLSRGFSYLDNVAEVRSLTQPLGRTLLQTDLMTGRGFLGGLLRSVGDPVARLMAHGDQLARQFYVGDLPGGRPHGVTRLDVILRSDPFDPASIATLKTIQYWLSDRLPASGAIAGSVRGECYGITVNAHDLADVIDADRTRVNLLVLTGVFLILLMVVRRPWLAAYLLVTVLFGYLATLGATALAAKLWLGEGLGEIDWRVPFFLFTILVAVGEDYNIFVVTRMLQERKRFGAVEGVRRAIAQTGSTITCCGAIMAGTFATLMLAGLGTLVQIGFALAFGVLLDTFVIRPVLVPVFTLCVWTGFGQGTGVRSQGSVRRRQMSAVRRSDFCLADP